MTVPHDLGALDLGREGRVLAIATIGRDRASLEAALGDLGRG